MLGLGEAEFVDSLFDKLQAQVCNRRFSRNRIGSIPPEGGTTNNCLKQSQPQSVVQHLDNTFLEKRYFV